MIKAGFVFCSIAILCGGLLVVLFSKYIEDEAQLIESVGKDPSRSSVIVVDNVYVKRVEVAAF